VARLSLLLLLVLASATAARADKFGGLVGFAPPPLKCQPAPCEFVGGTGTDERQMANADDLEVTFMPGVDPNVTRVGQTFEVDFVNDAGGSASCPALVSHAAFVSSEVDGNTATCTYRATQVTAFTDPSLPGSPSGPGWIINETFTTEDSDYYAILPGLVLAGSVRTADDGPPPAPIELTVEGGSPFTSRTVRTNSAGDYAVALPDGTYTVTPTAPGTVPAVRLVALPPDQLDVDFTLFDGPIVSVDDVTLAEGDEGFTPFTFTLTLDRAADEEVSVRAFTQNGTAVAPGDFTAVDQMVTFPAGETVQTVTVQVKGDTTFEPDELFSLELADADGLAIADGSGLGTIRNDDAGFFVDDASVIEGDEGTVILSFPVRRSPAADAPGSVRASTADGSATAPADYVAKSAVVAFTPGQGTASFDVTVNGDVEPEDDPDVPGVGEVFRVVLSEPDGAEIVDGEAIGTIVDDDPPGIVAHDVSVSDTAEPGQEGTIVSVSVPITLTSPAPAEVTVAFETVADGNAIADTDFLGSGGTVRIPAGALEGAAVVGVLRDRSGLDAEPFEDDETFSVRLSEPVGATLIDDTAVVTILGDALPFEAVMTPEVFVPPAADARVADQRLDLSLDGWHDDEPVVVDLGPLRPESDPPGELGPGRTAYDDRVTHGLSYFPLRDRGRCRSEIVVRQGEVSRTLTLEGVPIERAVFARDYVQLNGVAPVASPVASNGVLACLGESPALELITLGSPAIITAPTAHRDLIDVAETMGLVPYPTGGNAIADPRGRILELATATPPSEVSDLFRLDGAAELHVILSGEGLDKGSHLDVRGTVPVFPGVRVCVQVGRSARVEIGVDADGEAIGLPAPGRCAPVNSGGRTNGRLESIISEHELVGGLQSVPTPLLAEGDGTTAVTGFLQVVPDGTGTAHVIGNFDFRGATLFARGDLHIDGDIEGIGAILATGAIRVRGRLRVESERPSTPVTSEFFSTSPLLAEAQLFIAPGMRSPDDGARVLRTPVLWAGGDLVLLGDGPLAPSETASVAPGGEVTVGADDLPPGTDVGLELESEPVDLGRFPVAADGTLTATVTVPSDAAAGLHHIRGAVGERTLEWPIEVVVPPVCAEGADIRRAIVKLQHRKSALGDERALLRGTLDLPAGTPPTFDPTAQGMRLRLEDLGSGARLIDVVVPPGGRGSGCAAKDGWKNTAYRNVSGALDAPACTAGSAQGLRALRLKDRRAKGKGIVFVATVADASLAPPVGPLALSLAVGERSALGVAEACGRVAFAASACQAGGKTYVCH
jgi:hypothetical protein